MKTLYLLLVLTKNSAGDINSAFVNTETLQQCQKKAMMVESVFNNSNIPIIESRCIKSELKFSEFEHVTSPDNTRSNTTSPKTTGPDTTSSYASSSKDIRNFYLIHLDNDVTMITAMPDWTSCIKNRKDNIKLSSADKTGVEIANAAQNRVYCSSTVQSMR